MSYNRFRQSKQQNSPTVTRYVKNVGVVTKMLASGYLPIRHNSLPKPFVSFEIETDAGVRYVLQVQGRQAVSLVNVRVEVGMSLAYEGRFHKECFIQGKWHGAYFLASQCELVSHELDPYVLRLLAAKKDIESAGRE
jgi:hypothetical protein